MAAQPMSAADAAWLRMDRPENLMVVNSVLALDSLPAPGAIERLLQERLVDRFPRFGQRVVERGPLRRPAWSDGDFDVSNHVVHARLPAPGGDAELQEYVAEQISLPLPRDVPLWQVHLIEGHAGSAAMFARLHHCIADGVTLARVLLSLTDAAAADDFTDTTRGRSVVDIGHEMFELVVHPSRLGRLAATTPKVGIAVGKELLSTRGTHAPLVGRIGRDKRVSWSSPAPLAPLREAAHRYGATVNDVVLAAVSGALRSSVKAHGDGAVADARVIVPYNLRGLDRPLPRELGNRFGLVFLSLPLTIDDALERVAEVRRRMEEVKHSPEPSVSYGVLELVGRTTPGVEHRLVDFFASKAVGVVTNVRGPEERLTLAGVPVRRVIPFVPTSGDQAIGISIFSHAGELTVGFVADARVVPDLDEIADAYVAELDRLVEAGTAVSERVGRRGS